ncbi:flagellin, partial [Pseudoalteromonas sp. SYSU M81241]
KRNAQDAVSLVQTGEGALTEVHSMLQRMRDLSVQSANDTNDAKGRQAIAAEIGELKEQVRNVLVGTEFNGRKLFVSQGKSAPATQA